MIATVSRALSGRTTKGMFVPPSAVQKLVDRGYLNGTGEGLELSADMVRLLVILDRAGAFK